jgi:hypothetical protein
MMKIMLLEAIMRELDKIKALLKVKSKGSLSDSFSIHSAHEMQLIKKLVRSKYHLV